MWSGLSKPSCVEWYHQSSLCPSPWGGGGGLGCAPSALLGLSFLPLNTSACDFSSVWATPVA